MATSIGQNAPVFLPGKPSSLPDREAWQATVYRVSKSRTQKRPCAHRCKSYFACGSSAPARAEHEGGAAAWLAGALEAPSVQGPGLPPPQELTALSESFFEPFLTGDWKASLARLSL